MSTETYSTVKRLLLGQPFPTRDDVHQRLDKARALAIFASDPISSNAYATEAIMSVLILMGASALSLTLPLALAIFVLVLLVVTSYIQTIRHYPDGGGAYTVTKDNLGRVPSLFAAAALLTDYVLTVSVSVSAGIRAVTSAVPELFDERVLLAMLAILILTWINLRGVRESGTIFALPTYAFVGGVFVVILLGLARMGGLFGLSVLPAPSAEVEAIAPVSDWLAIWLLLRAFAAGCTALTGIEAISNGTQAFKKPEAKNAAQTMVAMGVIAMTLFLGISFLATRLQLVPHEGESILSQMARAIAGDGVLYIWVQFFTMMILILAANTGFQDFPRLSSYLAKDGFMPRWMQNRGDRLVYSSGIVVLAMLAALLVIVFQADEIAMLPLYALGVMLSFTLSQFGMVRLMGRIGKLQPGETMTTQVTTIHHEDGWLWKRALNFVGGATTLIVLIILVITKFAEGAWVIVLAIPLFVLLFRNINGHYDDVAARLSTRGMSEAERASIADVVIVPIADVHRGTLRALEYAQRLSSDVRAVSIITDETMRERVERRWYRFPYISENAKLVLVDYEYRDLLTPLVQYIRQVNEDEFPDQLITVVIPEFLSRSLPAQMLHNQTARLLRNRLLQDRDIILIDVPYLVD